MFYFMSDIHGNARAYFALKAEIDFDYNDKLYILGNIFDGNSEHPEHCLEILDDIIGNDNITLILGNHEYTHVLYHMSGETEAKMKLEEKLKQMEPKGKPLLDYMKKLPREKLDRYISYLVGCEVSELVKIEKRYFYLVHGTPALLSECGSVDKWQEIVASKEIDMKRSYQKEIATDPYNSVENDWSYDDTIIICGNLTGKDIWNSIPQIKKEQFESGYTEYQRVAFYDNKMLINCGCQGDEPLSAVYTPTLACVSIDGEGYSVTYEYNIFDI